MSQVMNHERPPRTTPGHVNVDTFIKAAQAAGANWLEQNRELAARYCVTTLRQ